MKDIVIQLYNHFVSYFILKIIAWAMSQNRVAYAIKQDVVMWRSITIQIWWSETLYFMKVK